MINLDIKNVNNASYCLKESPTHQNMIVLEEEINKSTEYFYIDKTALIELIKKRRQLTTNNNCSRPDGCYSHDTGKTLCALGCDCSCHDN